MQETITLQTHQREILLDLTPLDEGLVQDSGISTGLVNVYAQGATAAIMIQENWDESVQTDVVNLLRKMIPKGIWQHDAQDGNGDFPGTGAGIIIKEDHLLPGAQRDCAVNYR